MTKVTYKGRPSKDLSKLTKNDKSLDQAGPDPRIEICPKVESVKVNLRKAAQETQKLAVPLTRKGHEFVAEKIRQLKEIVAKGEYEVDPREVAMSMLRDEIPWHLEKRKGQLMNLDLTELLALRRKRNCAEKIATQCGRSTKPRCSMGRHQAKSLHNQT